MKNKKRQEPKTQLEEIKNKYNSIIISEDALYNLEDKTKKKKFTSNMPQDTKLGLAIDGFGD